MLISRFSLSILNLISFPGYEFMFKVNSRKTWCGIVTRNVKAMAIYAVEYLYSLLTLHLCNFLTDIHLFKCTAERSEQHSLEHYSGIIKVSLNN